MRILYSNLRFGRPTIEDKFRLLKAVVAKAFEGTELDPDELILEYASMIQRQKDLVKIG